MVNESRKPNVLMILTDDQGYWSLGCYGNKKYIRRSWTPLRKMVCGLPISFAHHRYVHLPELQFLPGLSFAPRRTGLDKGVET